MESRTDMMAGKVFKILIGDAQPRVRFGLRLLLEQQPGWQIAGEAEDAQMLLAQVSCGSPDLVLLDWDLPGMPAQELLAAIRHSCPHLWVVFMGGKEELRQMVFQAGADIFAYKADPPENKPGGQKTAGQTGGDEAEDEPAVPLQSGGSGSGSAPGWPGVRRAA